jgi:hypothetical protein
MMGRWQSKVSSNVSPLNMTLPPGWRRCYSAFQLHATYRPSFFQPSAAHGRNQSDDTELTTV